MTTEEYRSAANYWKDKEAERKAMPQDELKAVVDKYLSESPVCALATGYGGQVRCTPLEYSYHDGKFWIFTEGGMKFAGLEKNDNVSLAVFDRNTNFAELKGVQVTGKAALIEPMSPAYIAHAEYKKVSVALLQKMTDQGRPMHLLCITPTRAEVLFSEFKKRGYDSRQVIEFA